MAKKPMYAIGLPVTKTPESFARLFADDDISNVLSDGGSSDVDEWIDSGSYTLNLLLAGTIYGGLPVGRAVAIAGEEATGKTYFAMDIIANLEKSLGAPTAILYYDTETAVSKKMAVEHGINPDMFIRKDPEHIEDFRSNLVQNLNKYMENPQGYRMAVVLDSLGNLSSRKEVEDITAGKDTRDLTKSQLLKATFRMLTRKCGRAKVPFIITNHLYDVIGSNYPLKTMSGGSGLKYAASIILFITKAQDKDNQDKKIGNIISVRAKKSRFTKEDSMVKVRLNFETGIDRYYGMLELAEEYGLVKRESKQKVFWPGEEKAQFPSTIYKNPERFFTPEFLKLFEEKVSPNFRYGGGNVNEEDFEYDEDMNDIENNTGEPAFLA